MQTELDKETVKRIHRSIVKQLKLQETKPAQIARLLKVDRSVINRALDGGCSTHARVYIAMLLDTPPSTIWTFNPRLKSMQDDYYYNHPQELSKPLPKAAPARH